MATHWFKISSGRSLRSLTGTVCSKGFCPLRMEQTSIALAVFFQLSALRHFSCDVNSVPRFLKCKRLKFPWHYMNFGMPNRVHSWCTIFL